MNRIDARQVSGTVGASQPGGTVGASQVSGTVGARLATPAVNLWTPAELGNDLALWLDAQDESTLTKSDVDSDGSEEVEVWGDKSGNGNDASQLTESARPEFKATALNGKPALQFDGVDHLLKIPTLFSNGEQAAVAFVADSEMSSRDSSGPVIGDTGTGKNSHWPWSGGNKFSSWGAGSRNGGWNTGQDITTDHLAIFKNGSTWLARVNGRDDFSDSNTISWSTSQWYVGASGGGGFTLKGEVGNLFVWQDPTDTTLKKAEGHLAHKYDLTDKLPSSHPYKDSRPSVA